MILPTVWYTLNIMPIFLLTHFKTLEIKIQKHNFFIQYFLNIMLNRMLLVIILNTNDNYEQICPCTYVQADSISEHFLIRKTPANHTGMNKLFATKY